MLKRHEVTCINLDFIGIKSLRGNEKRHRYFPNCASVERALSQLLPNITAFIETDSIQIMHVAIQWELIAQFL